MNLHYFDNLHYDPFRKIKIQHHGLQISSYQALTKDAEGEEIRLHRNQLTPQENYFLKIEELGGFALGPQNQLSLDVGISLSNKEGKNLRSYTFTLEMEDWDAASKLSDLSLTPNISVEVGQTYYWKVLIKDKYSDNSMSITAEIEGVADNLAKSNDYKNKIEYNDTFFKIGENGLSVDGVAMIADDRGVNLSAIESTDFPIKLIINKIMGISAGDDMPDFSYRLLVLDMNGHELLHKTAGALTSYNGKFSALCLINNKDLRLNAQQDYLFAFALMDTDSLRQAAVIIRITTA